MAGSTFEFTAQSLEMLKEQIRAVALQKAVEEKVVARPEDAVVRELLPTDLGASEDAWEQTLNTAGGYNTIYNVDLDDKKVVTIYGVIVPNDTNATALKFNLGNSKVIDIWQIEKAKYLENPVLLADNPIYYSKSASIKIEAFAPSGTTVPATDKIILLGVVVEPKGKTISPDEQ